MDYEFLLGERFKTRGGAVFKVCGLSESSDEPCVQAALADDSNARMRTFSVESVLQRLVSDEMIDSVSPV